MRTLITSGQLKEAQDYVRGLGLIQGTVDRRRDGVVAKKKDKPDGVFAKKKDKPDGVQLFLDVDSVIRHEDCNEIADALEELMSDEDSRIRYVFDGFFESLIFHCRRHALATVDMLVTTDE